MIVLIILTLTILQTYITLMNQYRISTLLVIIFCSIIIKRIKYELFIDDTRLHILIYRCSQIIYIIRFSSINYNLDKL